MSKKKARRKKRNPMPPALKEYWAKKRAAKNRRKKRNSRRRRNPPGTVMKRYRRGKLRSSSGRKVKSVKQAKAILLSELRRAGYAIAPKPNPRRRRRSNPKPKLRSVRLPGTYQPRQLRAIKSVLSRATGMRVVVKR